MMLSPTLVDRVTALPLLVITYKNITHNEMQRRVLLSQRQFSTVKQLPLMKAGVLQGNSDMHEMSKDPVS